jgi:hypothetical protein
VKLKFYIPEILLGVLLTIAVFGMGMLFQSSSHQPSSNPPNSTAEQIQNAHKPDPFSWDWLTHDGVVFFTCVLAFVAVVQAVLFLWQLSYMSKGLKDAAIAAKAAKTAAEHIPTVEGAYVYVLLKKETVARDLQMIEISQTTQMIETGYNLPIERVEVFGSVTYVDSRILSDPTFIGTPLPGGGTTTAVGKHVPNPNVPE